MQNGNQITDYLHLIHKTYTHKYNQGEKAEQRAITMTNKFQGRVFYENHKNSKESAEQEKSVKYWKNDDDGREWCLTWLYLHA